MPGTANSFLEVGRIELTYRPLIDLVTCHDSTNEEYDIIGCLSWHRTKIIGMLRKLSKPTPSANWLISTFGPTEADYVLSSAAYFFSDRIRTRETVHHLAGLFTSERGWSLVSVTSLGELSHVYGSSQWLERVPDFLLFLTLKLDLDDREAARLDSAIDEHRGQLIMSKRETIRYIYLSFYQCLNRESFEKYTALSNDIEKVERCLADTDRGQYILSSFLDEEFRTRMKTYYNKVGFLNNYVNVRCLEAEGSDIPCYTLNASEVIKAWIGQSHEMTSFLTQVRELFPLSGIGQDLSGLLLFSTCHNWPLHNSDRCPQETFLNQRGWFPVYRSEQMGANYFITMVEDSIEHHWAKMITRLEQVPHQVSAEGEEASPATSPDELHTVSLIYNNEVLVSPQTSWADKLVFSRHEYFNARLPVYNLVLDFDLPLNEDTKMPPLSKIIRLCREIRKEIIDSLRILGEVDDSHYVLFFKSSCPPLPSEVENDECLFCTCSEKLGLRIVCPLPRDVAFAGGGAVTGLVKIINRLVKMNAEICSLFPSIKGENGPFDLGIYSGGRCIRLPNTFKGSGAHNFQKLLKILVILPAGGTIDEYMYRCTHLEYLLHHAKPRNHCTGGKNLRLVYEVVDSSEDFLELKTIQQLPKQCKDVVGRIESQNGTDLIDWISERVWPDILKCIKLYLREDKILQFSNVRFERGINNIVIVKPHRGKNFSCINFNHKNKAQAVRIFLVLHLTNYETVTTTFMSQCFSSKCSNNRSTAHFSVATLLHYLPPSGEEIEAAGRELRGLPSLPETPQSSEN